MDTLGEGDVQQGCTDRVSGKACMLSSRVVHRVAHTQTHTQTHTHACSNSPPTLVVDLGLVTAELHAVQRSPRLGEMHVRETRKSRRISIVHVVQLPIKEAVSRKFSQLSVHACVRVPVSACMCVCMHVSVRVYMCMSVHTHAPHTAQPEHPLTCCRRKHAPPRSPWKSGRSMNNHQTPLSRRVPCRPSAECTQNTSPFRAGTSVRSHLDLGQRRQVAHNLIGQQHCVRNELNKIQVQDPGQNAHQAAAA